jgi:hypothetical protein
VSPPDAAEHSGPWAEGGPASEDELEFTRREMTQWLNPRQLAGTAVRSVLGAVFGSYADQREMQAALRHPGKHDYSKRDELWLDYVADLGDGFRPTFTLAWLLSRRRLSLRGPDGGTEHDTPRGSILVMGGDQVYPTASREEYQDRTVGPYEAALPCHSHEDHPHLFAIPGNHDWYDGLTAFTRLFMQRRWIGGWETCQSRSYWSLQLPHRWWVLGTDIQLHADIDQPQIDYFTEVAGSFHEGDRVILITAEPAWVHTPERPDAYGSLAYFERHIIQPRGAKLVLTVTGDLHHYARYTDDTGERHKLTAGGGGAYLYGTHRLPSELSLPERQGTRDVPTRWTRRAEYPSLAESRTLRRMAVVAPLNNRGFTLVLAGLYAFFAWNLENARLGPRNLESFMSTVARLSWGEWKRVGGMVAQAMQHSPTLVILAAFLVFAWWSFCKPDQGRGAWRKHLGALHGVAHLALLVALTWGFARLNAGVLGMEPGGFAAGALFLAEMVVVGGLLGGLLVGLFLLPGVNFEEAFAAQGRTGWKNFLRLHVASDGSLTVYPVGIRHAGKWRFVPRAPRGESFFEPEEGKEPEARLIEAPLTLPAPPGARVNQAG